MQPSTRWPMILSSCALLLAGCGGGGGGQSDGAGASGSELCVEQGHEPGYFRAELSGGIDRHVDWDNSTACGFGAKRFSFAVGEEAFLVSVPDLTEGQLSSGSSSVDMLLVVNGDADSYLTDKTQCEVSIERQDVILDAGSGPRIWRVAGKGSCSSAAETVQSGPVPILVESFEFAGPAFFN